MDVEGLIDLVKYAGAGVIILMTAWAIGGVIPGMAMTALTLIAQMATVAGLGFGAWWYLTRENYDNYAPLRNEELVEIWPTPGEPAAPREDRKEYINIKDSLILRSKIGSEDE